MSFLCSATKKFKSMNYDCWIYLTETIKDLVYEHGITGGNNSQCLKVLMGEGNDNPLQYSCLENPMDRGA